MPIIKPRTNRVRTVRHICRLLEPNREVLTQYARFIGDTADYVLNQLIDGTLAKDREFVSWRAEQHSARDTGASSPGAPTRRNRAEQAV